ncbi:MAG: hypothetical protein EXS16_09025 [Gemmataceae bacterium]|nr:hypothetical protein [Gemmataceae bacterium]
MTLATIDLAESSRAVLRELVDATGKTPNEVVGSALDAYRRQLFFEKLNAGYAELRSDPVAWAEFQSEFAELDSVPIDGLPEERWTEDGLCISSLPEDNTGGTGVPAGGHE